MITELRIYVWVISQNRNPPWLSIAKNSMPDSATPTKDAGMLATQLQTAPAVGQPLYAPIAHPELRQLSQREIITFLQDWDNIYHPSRCCSRGWYKCPASANEFRHRS